MKIIITMKTTGKILASLLFLLATSQLFAQDVPDLKDSELLQKSDLKKKPGWIKIELDSAFHETDTDISASYEYYEFVNKKGQYNSTYTTQLPFVKSTSKITYTRVTNEKTKLLSGFVNFYDKQNNIFMRYVFKDGFYVKVCDWKKQGKQVNTLIEYIPKKNSVELYANYFDASGNITSSSHEENDGYTYKTIPDQKIITPISK